MLASDIYQAQFKKRRLFALCGWWSATLC